MKHLIHSVLLKLLQILGADFVPYLKFALPSILKSAGLKLEFHVSAGIFADVCSATSLPFEVDDNDDEEDELQEGWEFLIYGDKVLCSFFETYSVTLSSSFPSYSSGAKFCQLNLSLFAHSIRKLE